MAEPGGPQGFLEEGAVAVDPVAIPAALRALWEPDTAHPALADRGPVTRLSLGTIVALTNPERERLAGALWRNLTQRHPSRVILAVLEPEGDDLRAAISADCHLPAPGEPQICSERIRLACGPDRLDRLPGLILPLLEPDVPATVWWDLPQSPPRALAAALGRVADRCLADLTRADRPGESYRALREQECGQLQDLAWFRALKWREATARLFDGLADRATLAAIEQVEVVGAADREAQLVPAALLGGWVAGQLGWQPLERRSEGAGAISIWRRGSGQGELRLATAAVGDQRPGRLQALRLHAPARQGRWTIERLTERPRELRIEAHQAAWCELPSRLPSPRPEPLEVLLNSLTAPPRNLMRDRALRHAAWLMGWANDA